MEAFSLLGVAQIWESVARNDDPASKLNEVQIDQVRLQRSNVSQNKEEHSQQPCLPRLHGRDNVHRIDFAIDIAHAASMGPNVGD